MLPRLGVLLVLVGCGGLLVLAYLLCADVVREVEDAMLAGQVNWLGIAIVAGIAAVAAGALLVAYGVPTPRPGWATFVLVLAVLIPVSIGLWFGLLCRLL